MNNGLELKTVKSTVNKGSIETVGDLLETIKTLDNHHFVVAYLSYGVFIGYVKQGKIVFYSKDIGLKRLTEIRVFNKEEELYAYKDGGKFRYRLRKDEEGLETDVVDAKQVVIGTVSKSLSGNWTSLKEDRGTEITVPFNITVDKDKRLTIHTRNYISYSNSGQATFSDSRLIEFLDSNNMPLEVNNERNN